MAKRRKPKTEPRQKRMQPARYEGRIRGSSMPRVPATPQEASELAERYGRHAEAVLILRELSYYCDEAGMVYPSQETVARNTGLAVATVRSIIKDLAALDLVEISERPGVEGHQGQHRLTGYRTGGVPMVDIDDTHTEDEP